MGQAGAAPKPVVVFEDPSGDANLVIVEEETGLDSGQSIPGGWDLAKGTIAKRGTNLEFTVTHADMPPVGSAPEATRFLWSFAVDGLPYRLSAKSADIGKPDVVAGQTSDRVGEVDLDGHFRLEGMCVPGGPGGGQVLCPLLEYLEGSFDTASMTFTVIVPLKSIDAKSGSVIGPATGWLCGPYISICWITHVAERSSATTVIDSVKQLAAYTVPKK